MENFVKLSGELVQKERPNFEAFFKQNGCDITAAAWHVDANGDGHYVANPSKNDALGLELANHTAAMLSIGFVSWIGCSILNFNQTHHTKFDQSEIDEYLRRQNVVSVVD